MLRYIYRQRRRLLFGWFFFLLLVLTMFVREGLYDPVDYTNPLYWAFIGAAAAVLTAAVFLGVALFIALAPRWRHLVELSFFITFLSYALDLNGHANRTFGLAEGYNWMAFFAVFFVVYSLTYGVWLDRFRLGLDMRTTRAFRLAAPPAEVWPAFSLPDGGAARSWEPILHDATPRPDEPNVYDVRYTLGASVFETQTHRILAREAPHHYAYAFCGETSAANQPLTEGELDLHLEDDGAGGSRGTLTIARRAMLPRDALNAWFDDRVGDQLDSFRARTGGKRDWSITGVAHRKMLSLS